MKTPQDPLFTQHETTKPNVKQRLFGPSLASSVPKGHHPRGTTLREALRGNLPLRGVLRGLCGGLSEGSAGLYGALRDFPRFVGGSDPVLVTLGVNYWISLGSTISPDTKHTRHETSSLGGFSAATTVGIASQGCPCRVQQQLGSDFGEVDLDSNFSIFGVRRFTEWPGPLH